MILKMKLNNQLEKELYREEIMKKEKLTIGRKIELEEIVLSDSFFNDDNKNIKYYDEIKLHYKKLKLSKEETSYLIISTIIPFQEFKLDLEKLYNGEYSPYRFLFTMMKKYLYEPTNQKEFNNLKEIIIYRLDSFNEIKEHINFNVTYKKIKK